MALLLIKEGDVGGVLDVYLCLGRVGGSGWGAWIRVWRGGVMSV